MISTKHINKYLSIFHISNIEGDTLDGLAQAALSARVGAVLPRPAHEAALLGPARPLPLPLRGLGCVPGPVLQPGRGDPGVRGEDVALAVVITQRRLGSATVTYICTFKFFNFDTVMNYMILSILCIHQYRC